ncbi:DUF1934 domain-containing protein [Paenibacillus ehimensis]|uniref:DUF1934 domain-containing protein n=1 Tax=Paenibacillus ehimensis TaxID=79264 RepID=A0ABT8VIB6_9BACL|nr:DUF1934 domain-containing protein [Paenibacillus ehimensis]MDO3680705.1 DUF1934 domain-containing protein [Paenibacillus ehimensis]
MMEKQQSGAGKRAVRIMLESDSGGERIVRQMTGEWFSKGRHAYLRYAEPPEAEMGRTVTTVRMEQGEVRIVRHGDVSFEQTFVPGRRHYGYLQTSQGRLELETFTRTLDVAADGPGAPLAVRWSYELSVMGQAPESCSICLTAVPVSD